MSLKPLLYITTLIAIISLTQGFSITQVTVPTGTSTDLTLINDKSTSGADVDYTQIVYNQNNKYTFTMISNNCSGAAIEYRYDCDNTQTSVSSLCSKTTTANTRTYDETDFTSCGVTCTPSNFKLYISPYKNTATNMAVCVIVVRVNATDQCNGHGTYDPNLARCRCSSPFSGAACDKQVMTIADGGRAGTAITVTTQPQEEVYFTFAASSPTVNKDLKFKINASPACTSDLDIYMYYYCGTSYTDTVASTTCYNRWSNSPAASQTTCTSSDCEITTTTYSSKSSCGCGITSSVKTDLPNLHYDFRVKYNTNNPACTWTLNMTTDSYCHNGNWDGSKCRCNSPWAGSRCDKQVVTLADNGATGSQYTNTLDAGAEDYFTFQQANQGVPKDIVVTVTGGACKANLDIYQYGYCGTSYTDVTSGCYNRWSGSTLTTDTSCSTTCEVSRNTHATTSSCGCSITSSNKADADKQHFDYRIRNADSSNACTYTVTLKANSDCLHGTFTNGKCICTSPWAGDKCDKQVVQLPYYGSAPTKVNRTLAAGAEDYFTAFVGGPNGKYVRFFAPSVDGNSCADDLDIYVYTYCGDSYSDTSGCNRWSGTAKDSATSSTDRAVRHRSYEANTACGCDISSTNTLTETYRDIGRLHFDFRIKNAGSNPCTFTATMIVDDDCNYRGVQTKNYTSASIAATAACKCTGDFSGSNCQSTMTQLQNGVKQAIPTRYSSSNEVVTDSTNVVMYMDQPFGNYKYSAVVQQTLGVGSNCGSSTTKTMKLFLDCDNTCGSAAVTKSAYLSKSIRLLNTEQPPVEYSLTSTSGSGVTACGCNKTNIESMRAYFQTDTSTFSTPNPFFCSFDLTVTRTSECTPADCWGNGECVDGGVCKCKEGFEGITCYAQSNNTNLVNEIYAGATYNLGSQSGEPAVIWYQISKSNSIAQLKVTPTTYRTSTSLTSTNQGDAYVFAKWKSMPKVTSKKGGYFSTYNQIDSFACEDCDFQKIGPLVNNITLDIDPKSMKEANQGLYVVIGVSGIYQAKNFSASGSSSYQRTFKVTIDIQDPNGAVVIVIFVLLIAAFIGYIYYGVKSGKYNPKDHAEKAVNAFNTGFEKLEDKMLTDMKGEKKKEEEEEEEEEEEGEGEEGEESEADKAKAEAKEKAEEGVDVAQVKVKEGAAKAAASTKAAAKTVTDPLQILLILVTNLLSLFFAMIKTLFNMSLLFRNFQGVFPAMNVDFYAGRIAIVLGGLGDLLIGFTAFLGGIDIVGSIGSEWNCGGAGVILAPFILAIGALFLRVLLKRDFLLLSNMWLNAIKKRQPAGKRKAIVAGLCNSANAIIFYTVQIVVLTVGGLTSNLLGGRNCGSFDLIIRYFGGFVVGIMLLVFFVTHFSLFAGDDPIVQNMDEEEKKAVLKKTGWVGIAMYFFRGLYRLLQLMFGIWQGSQVRAFRIKERAEKYDDDDEDDDTQHEAVIAAVAKSSGLIWLLFPLMIVATKITEALNNPAAITFLAKEDDKLDMITDTKQRWISYVSNLLNMLGIVIFVASADVGALVLALLALLPPFILALWNELRGGTA